MIKVKAKNGKTYQYAYKTILVKEDTYNIIKSDAKESGLSIVEMITQKFKK